MENQTEESPIETNHDITTAKLKNPKKAHKELNITEEMVINDPRGYKIHKVSKLSRLINEFTTLSRK